MTAFKANKLKTSRLQCYASLLVSLISGSIACFAPSSLLAMPTDLVVGVTDTTRYGFSYEGVFANRADAEFTFAGTGSGIDLDVTGFDIDSTSEVSILVNDSVVGALTVTPNNSTGFSEISIPSSFVVNGTNTLRFVQRVPGYRWGITDLLLEQALENGPTTLVVGIENNERFGFRYLGQNSNQEFAEFAFDSDDSPVDLTVLGYDIDSATEVEITVNGASVGFLEESPNNSTIVSNVFISSQALVPGSNLLRFEQRVPGYRWGITDLLVEISSAGPSVLEIGIQNSERYGYSYLSIFNNRETAGFVFDYSGSDLLTLDVTGYDIDSTREVSVLVNDSRIGYLTTTNNNESGPSQLPIPTSALVQGTNTLTFVQFRPGYRWGITNITLDSFGLPPPPPPPTFP